MGAVIEQKTQSHKRAAIGVAPQSDARRHILTCAARLFRAHGYAAVSLRDVAREGGVTTGSLYHHFRSKDDLVWEILDQGYEQILREVQAAVLSPAAQASPQATLFAALLAHLTCLLASDSLPAANIRIFAHVPKHVRDATLKGRRNYERFWTDLLGTYASEGLLRAQIEPKSLVMILFGAMNWSLEWFKPGRDDVEDLATDLMELVGLEP